MIACGLLDGRCEHLLQLVLAERGAHEQLLPRARAQRDRLPPVRRRHRDVNPHLALRVAHRPDNARDDRAHIGTPSTRSSTSRTPSMIECSIFSLPCALRSLIRLPDSNPRPRATGRSGSRWLRRVLISPPALVTMSSSCSSSVPTGMASRPGSASWSTATAEPRGSRRHRDRVVRHGLRIPLRAVAANHRDIPVEPARVQVPPRRCCKLRDPLDGIHAFRKSPSTAA